MGCAAVGGTERAGHLGLTRTMPVSSTPHLGRAPRTPSLPSLAQHLAAPPSLSPFDQSLGSAFFLLHLVSLTSSRLDQSWLPCRMVCVSVLHGGCESPAEFLSFLGSAQAL